MRAGRQATRAAGVSAWQHVSAVLLLPFMNTVLIPGLILSFARDLRIAGDAATLAIAALGVVLAAAGLALVVRSIALFVRIGRGTLAP